MIHWIIVHARWWWQDLRLLATRSLHEFVDDRCTQIAASISYYVFFSIFPLIIFLVTAFGQVLRNDDVKDRVIDVLIETLPLAPDGARDELQSVLDGVATNLSLLGLLSIVGLI
ncbi:MAG: YhjD/YihY/BrkB family envelope integrity protein, partial [Chloroflexota bacterium]